MLNESPLYRFDLDSLYYIDSDDKIHITNFKDVNGSTITVSLDTTSKLDIIYVSNIIPTNYVSSDMDLYLQSSYLVVGNCVVTLEEININIGNRLDNLYRRIHSSTGLVQYATHENDVPMRYKTNVYGTNNEILHFVNEIVYDDEGEIVYENMKGDVVLNEQGLPVVISESLLDRYMNLLFIDYRCTVSNKVTIKDYNKYLKEYLTDKITIESERISEELLDNTKAYVVVPKSINKVKVKTPTKTVYIDSMQSFIVNVYVSDRVYKDIESKNSIQYTVVKIVDDYLYSNTVLNKTELLNLIYTKLKEIVYSVGLEKFTELNEDYIEILDNNSRISVDKELIVEMDGYDIKDKVTVNFKISNV